MCCTTNSEKGPLREDASLEPDLLLATEYWESARDVRQLFALLLLVLQANKQDHCTSNRAAEIFLCTPEF